MYTTKVFSRNLEAFLDPNVRTIVNVGSTRSSKTWSELQLNYIIACNSKRPRLISFVSESMPHLKRGCIRDFERMLRDESLFDDQQWNSTDKIYTVGDSAIEFFSADQPGKVLGPARDILVMNECNRMPYETFRQLAVRTTEKIFLDYNPEEEFWVDEFVIPRKDTIVIHSTYLDNDMLSEAQVKEIESYRNTDPEWFNVYGLGLKGTRQGLIVNNWDIVKDMPADFKREFIGIDFGYNDPTAVVHMRQSHGEIFIDELVYESGLDNPEIAAKINDYGLSHVRIIADSAEPKSIHELHNAGLIVEPAQKGPDSIKLGIKIMNRYKKHYTERSLNLIKENRNYRYKQDMDGNSLNVPIDRFNHGKDAERYVFLNCFAETNESFDIIFSK